MEWLLDLALRDQALDGDAALTVCPFPASRRPIRAQLGALDSRAFGPRFLQPRTGASRGPRRSLAGDSP
jgi:hypothetical protein